MSYEPTPIRRLVIVNGVAQWFDLDPEPKANVRCEGDQHVWPWVPASLVCRCGAARVDLDPRQP